MDQTTKQTRRRNNELLTAKQMEAVVHWRGNMTEACSLAGYRFPDVAGAKLMRLPSIQRALMEKQLAIIRASAVGIANEIQVKSSQRPPAANSEAAQQVEVKES